MDPAPDEPRRGAGVAGTARPVLASATAVTASRSMASPSGITTSGGRLSLPDNADPFGLPVGQDLAAAALIAGEIESDEHRMRCRPLGA